jgi:hypothetical protein
MHNKETARLTDEYFIVGQLCALYHGAEKTRITQDATNLNDRKKREGVGREEGVKRREEREGRRKIKCRVYMCKHWQYWLYAYSSQYSPVAKQ